MVCFGPTITFARTDEGASGSEYGHGGRSEVSEGFEAVNVLLVTHGGASMESDVTLQGQGHSSGTNSLEARKMGRCYRRGRKRVEGFGKFRSSEPRTQSLIGFKELNLTAMTLR